MAIAHTQGESCSDAELIERVRNGDYAAFDALAYKYRDRIYSVIYNLVANQEDALDLTQDVFIKIFHSLPKFKGNASFYTWAYRIAVNTAYNFLKKRNRRHFYSYSNINEDGASEELLRKLASDSDADATMLKTELQVKLNEAIQALAPKHRTVVILNLIEDLSYEEIAQILKCSIGTVRSRLHYAKTALQSSLSQYLD